MNAIECQIKKRAEGQTAFGGYFDSGKMLDVISREIERTKNG